MNITNMTEFENTSSIKDLHQRSVVENACGPGLNPHNYACFKQKVNLVK